MFNEAIKPALKEGNIRIKFKEYPIGLRKEELNLAIAATCAGEQKNYIEFSEYLYSNWKVSSQNLDDFVTQHSLNKVAFNNCLSSPSSKQKVLADYQLGEELKIKGAPSFRINKMVFSGARDYKGLLEAIKSAYASEVPR